ncbi:MAG TPA: thioredoxin domain-containing protein [Planctomycetota bacterium]|nr:thioredoxin domain-containing protein [Planctomycetota bacterium]
MRSLMAALLLLMVPQDKPADEKKMEHQHTNRLAKEKSPYLLQHAHNPVDWYPWGSEAFEKAKKEDKPIFLSIGYSTCHWCHVMEHESFEDEDVAKFLNENFVPIKVDREERPDVDQIYMSAVQAMNNQGGWPLSAWLTPDLKPFMGGTYFPKEDRYGRPGFMSILKRITELWKEKRKELNESADQVGDYLKKMSDVEAPGEVKLEAAFEKMYFQSERSYEPRMGGFSQQPKFPHSTTISYLMRHYVRTGEKKALEMVEKSLTEMSRGGIYDQLGGGFARYSTDGEWLVPHFEKMLYDNALLAACYLEAWQLTKKDLYARVVRETLDYILRDMTSKEGGFYSAEDADSEKIEGKFYVWNPTQVVEVLGKDADRFMKAFDVTPRGNWEPHEESIPKNQSVLHIVEDGDFSDLKKKMFEARSKRVRPHLDDKVLTGWNALMISAMAQAGAALDVPRYRDAAVRAAEFLLTAHRKAGMLLRTSRLGEAKLNGYLEDYAYLAAAMLDLYEATFDGKYFNEAQSLVAAANTLFWDETAGGYFVSAKSHESLIARMREEYEGPHPSGNSVMTLTLLKLFDYTGDAAYRDRADKVVRSFKSHLERNPMGHGWMMVALDHLKGPSKEIVIAGPDPGPLLKVVRSRYLPNKVLALADGKASIPVLEGRTAVQGKTAAYVCENMTCRKPVTSPEELEALLK